MVQMTFGIAYFVREMSSNVPTNKSVGFPFASPLLEHCSANQLHRDKLKRHYSHLPIGKLESLPLQ